MTTEYLNVKRFGAKGNGKTDDTRAIQKALDAASDATITRQDTDAIPYVKGIPAQCGYHYHSTGPEVFFPHGHYIVTAPLLPRKALALRGEGYPWIEQRDPEQDLVYSEESIRQNFTGLAFHGGRMHLNLGNRNEDNGLVRIEDCKFYGSKETAIRMRENSNSTELLVLRCQIVGCEQAVVSCTDIVHIREGWIAGGCSGDGAQIVNRNMAFLSLENLCLVPIVNGYDQRWIDNHGNVVCRNVRFGGEEAGFTPIVNFSKYSPLLLGNMVVMDSCWMVCGLGNAKRPCAISCEEIPNLIEVRNCNLAGIPPVMVSPKISPKTYFKVNPGMATYRFEGNTGELADRIPAMLRKPLLHRPPRAPALSESATRAAVRRARADWHDRRTGLPDVPYACDGHKQRVARGDYVDLLPPRCKWDLGDLMDGTAERNSRYFALAQEPDGMLVVRRVDGLAEGWPHILVRNAEVDLDRYPYLTWSLIQTGSPAGVSARVIDQSSGRALMLASSQVKNASYFACNLRALLNSSGKHTLNIKLYVSGQYFEGGSRRLEDRRGAKPGEFAVIRFLRAEK
ncbi:MAG: glycosyl hydrolase family 28-related protein [Kiritimatiellae bacterium]|nr:glycosyl hydrolase family 28-related protein [Kiritimatiellia bacterium]